MLSVMPVFHGFGLGIGIHTPYPNPDRRGYYNIQSFKDGLGFHLSIGYPF